MARFPDGWRPRREDEKFALRHGMNPKAVAHALRARWRAGLGAEGNQTDESAEWCAWVLAHAIEGPPIFPLF